MRIGPRYSAPCVRMKTLNGSELIWVKKLRYLGIYLVSSSYLRQVNEVNGGDNVFVRCVSVCLFVCLCMRSGRSWELNANSSKKIKVTVATDFKFDTSIPRDSSDTTPKIYPNGGVTRVT